MTTSRRQFLRGSVGVVGATVIGAAFLRRAFGDTAVPAGAAVNLGGSDEPVRSAFERARSVHRGVLVLVIPNDKLPNLPKDHEGVWERGHIYGEWLNHGSDAQLAPLATVEVVAATMVDLRNALPSLNWPSGEPLFIHVDVAGTVRALEAKVPRHNTYMRGAERASGPTEDELSANRIAIVGGLIQRSLPVPSAEISSLAAAARARLVKNRVPGTYWAHGSGCGETIEGDPHPDMVDCGMGHVPAKARRFLYLYTRTPYEQRELQQKRKGTSL